jgi:hypothetical protein
LLNRFICSVLGFALAAPNSSNSGDQASFNTFVTLCTTFARLSKVQQI